MREIEAKRKQLGGGAALFGGLMIAALAFSAGVVGARSHKTVESPAVRMETSSVGAGTHAMEPLPDVKDHEKVRVAIASGSSAEAVQPWKALKGCLPPETIDEMRRALAEASAP